MANLSTGRLSILLVDDEPGIVNALSLLINALGHKVIGFTDPLQALAHLKQNGSEVDFVLCDLRMPVLTGREVLMLSLSSAPSLPVVLMSAHADADQIEHLLALGAFDFLAKPFSPDQFRAVANKVEGLKLKQVS